MNTHPTKPRLSIELLEENTGQLAEQGLPKNPREKLDDKYELLKQSIINYPEFLEQNSLKVFPLPDSDHYIVIGGNMRYLALKELNYKEVTCDIFPADTPIERLKAYTILDNSSFGRWDWTQLSTEEWDAAQLHSWGIDCDFLGDAGEDWGMLDDVQGNTDSPDFAKKSRIVVVVPADDADLLCELRNKISDLAKEYAGVEVK